MLLNRTDNPLPGIVIRWTAQTAARLVDFGLDSCALLLKDKCPDTPESLWEQGIVLKEELSKLRKKMFRLEDSEPM